MKDLLKKKKKKKIINKLVSRNNLGENYSNGNRKEIL